MANDWQEVDDFQDVNDWETIEESPIPKSLYNLWGAHITPEQEYESPYLSALGKTAQEGIATPFLHFLNQAALNYPRALVQQGGYQYPQPQTLPGAALAYPAGVAGALVGGPAKIAEAVGRVPFLGGANALQRLLRGGARGAAMGGAYAPQGELLGLGQRAAQATIGGLVGAGTEGIIPPLVRGFRKLRAPAKPPITERIGYQKRDIGLKTQQALQDIRQNTQIATKHIKNTIQGIDDELLRAAETGSEQFQQKLPTFFKETNASYGQQLDDIGNTLAQSGRGSITRGEINDIITRSIDEADDILATTGKPFATLEHLRDKYSLADSPYATSQRINPADELLDFNEIVKDLRSIYRTVSTKARGGLAGFGEDDLAAAILRRNWGEFISREVPELAELNKAYTPVVRGMKAAHRIFKPARGEFETKAGTGFLKRAGLGKLEAGEEKLLSLLEEGSEFATGVGKISEPIKGIGKARAGGIETIKEIAAKGKARTEQLTKAKAERLAMLEKRSRDVAKLLANQKKANAIRKALLVGGGILATGGTGVYGIRRMIDRLGRRRTPYGGY